MKALQPFHQGQLDFFCAIYAVINALRLTGDAGLAEGREILAESLREVAARPLLWDAVLTNQTDYYWLLRWMFGHFGRKSGFGFRVGRLPAAPLSKKQRRLLIEAGKSGAEKIVQAGTGDAGLAAESSLDAVPVGFNAGLEPGDTAGIPEYEQYHDPSGIEGKTVADALRGMTGADHDLPGEALDAFLDAPYGAHDEPGASGPDGGPALGDAARDSGRGLYGLTDAELCAWVGLAGPAAFSLDSVTKDDLFLPGASGNSGGFGRELKWNMEELWPLLQSWLPVKSLFGSFNADRRRNRCLILRFHRHLYASHPPLISHWTVGRDFQRETLHLFDCTADKNAIHSLPFRECVLAELQLAPDRLIRLEPDSVFFIEKV